MLCIGKHQNVDVLNQVSNTNNKKCSACQSSFIQAVYNDYHNHIITMLERIYTNIHRPINYMETYRVLGIDRVRL